MSRESLLQIAAAAESRSEHPLARAIVTYVETQQIAVPEVNTFQAITGHGVEVRVGEQRVLVGNERLISEHVANLDHVRDRVSMLRQAGKTSILVALADEDQPFRLVGILALADVLRQEAAAAVQSLKRAGVSQVVMLTGDHKEVAAAIAAEAGVDAFHADLLPEDKVTVLRELRERWGSVAMIGDGVNDAPALATADVGIAMGAAGSDVALDSADIVLMSDDLAQLAYAIRLSKKARRTLTFNLGFAMTMIALMLIGIFTIALPMPLAVVGHEGGTVLVALNGLRLLFQEA